MDCIPKGMDALFIRNVRCFVNPGAVPLTPLTFLVGENSTGKSTFLACAKLAIERAAGYSVPDFNAEPFRLGAYEQIANYRGGRGGRATMFQIGVRLVNPEKVSTCGEDLLLHADVYKPEFATRIDRMVR